MNRHVNAISGRLSLRPPQRHSVCFAPATGGGQDAPDGRLHQLPAAEEEMIDVLLNGEAVTSMDMTKWTEAKKNPDGSDIPSWLSKPAATLDPKGYIGLQGKHAGTPIFFRNLKIKKL